MSVCETTSQGVRDCALSVHAQVMCALRVMRMMRVMCAMRAMRAETDETTARARDRRHVVLPPDIAKLLPKNRLLTEVRARDGDGGGRDGSTTRARRRDSFPRETKED